MTRATIGTILSVMLIFMAGTALGWGALINAVSMAFLAFQIRVFPYQWKRSVIVIKCRVFPTGRIVAGTTICTKLAAMSILRCMTGITISGGAVVLSVDVA